jgi:TPR repeat protein
MYEYGLGVPMDLHLAKRFYDEALSSDTQVRQPSARHGRCEVEGVGWAREV